LKTKHSWQGHYMLATKWLVEHSSVAFEVFTGCCIHGILEAQMPTHS
jgi:hypothetical protein